jgi:hypothetical protein
MNNFFISLASGLVGAVLVFLVQKAYQYLMEIRAPYTGTWYDSLYDEHGNVVKRDVLKIRQRGDTLTGNISRISPTEQQHRKWLFSGRLRSNNFFAIFWSTSHDVQSYGSWYLTQVDDDHFTGYYLSLHRTTRNDKIMDELKPIKATIERHRAH